MEDNVWEEKVEDDVWEAQQKSKWRVMYHAWEEQQWSKWRIMYERSSRGVGMRGSATEQLENDV